MSIKRKKSNNKNFNFIKNKKVIASIIFVGLVVVLGVAIMLLNDEGEIVASSSERNEAFAEFKCESTEYTITDEFSINILVESGESPVTFRLLKNEEEVLDGKLKKKEKYEKEISVEKEKQGEYVYKLEITPDFGEVVTKELVITISDKKSQVTEEKEKDKNKETEKETEKEKESEKDKNKNTEKDKVDNNNQNSNQSKPSEGEQKSNWSLSKKYDKGDVVEYAGQKYECILGHSSQSDWKPDSSPTLWKRK